MDRDRQLFDDYMGTRLNVQLVLSVLVQFQNKINFVSGSDG